MQDKLTLMIPGPTPVPETVLKAMGRHPIGHRSGEFQAIVRRTTEQLKWLHQTTSDVLVITGSGTAAMEAGIINTLSRGDKVLCGDNGKFRLNAPSMISQMYSHWQHQHAARGRR